MKRKSRLESGINLVGDIILASIGGLIMHHGAGWPVPEANLFGCFLVLFIHKNGGRHDEH